MFFRANVFFVKVCMMESSSDQMMHPDIIKGSFKKIGLFILKITLLGSIGAPTRANPIIHPPNFSFMPIGPAPPAPSYIPPVRPVVNNAG